jgi:hypothetical protein
LQIFFIFLYNGSTGVAVIENSRPAIYECILILTTYTLSLIDALHLCPSACPFDANYFLMATSLWFAVSRSLKIY